MARARSRTNVASKYQGKWEEFKQKTRSNTTTNEPQRLTPVAAVNSSSSSVASDSKRTEVISNTSSSNSSSNTTNNPRRVSFHGLQEQETKQSNHTTTTTRRKLLTSKTKDSQTKHPKAVKELQTNPRQWISKPLLAQQQQLLLQQQATHSARNSTNTTNSSNSSRIRRPHSISHSQAKQAKPTATPTPPSRMDTPSSNNVSVVVRLRPMVPHETERGAKKSVHKVRTMDSILNQNNHDEEVVRVELSPSRTAKGATKHKELVKCFALDGVLEEHDTQQDVYKSSGAYKAVSQDLFRGFHCTILAYGQSGSGKTYTMGTTAASTTTSSQDKFQVRGSDSLDAQAGVIQRACHDLFQQVEEQCMGDATVELSYLEIYNEEIRDLLSSQTSQLSHAAALQQEKERDRLRQEEGFAASSSNPLLQIREDPSGEVFVQGKTSVTVTSAGQVMELMRLANTKRVVASTKLNQVSSRSHAICILTVTGTNTYDVTFQSRLTLVDLAGSERLSKTENTGWRAKEGININAGLFVLGLVISALTETRPAHKRHPPYRESKLTRILQNSLGGNARTIMIACCSPTDYHCEETVNTLRYATQARNIENPAVANIVHDEHAEQVLKLQSQNDSLLANNASLQEQIAEYETLIRQISTELSSVKEDYENTTLELREVKQDYQTTSEQLQEIQKDFKSTVDQLQRQKKENTKKLSAGGYLYSKDFQGGGEEEDLLVDPNNTSVGTEPTADLTIGTTTNNRLTPMPQQEEEDESVPLSQVAPEECDQSQAISLLTEQQEWNSPENNNNPLLGDLQDLEDQTKEQQDERSAFNSILAEKNNPEENSLHSLQSLTTEIHDPFSNKQEEEEKKDAEQEACDASYQACKTPKLYCQDSLVDKANSEVMVEAVPLPYQDLTGVNLPSMSPTNDGTTPTSESSSKRRLDENHSLQSGTITQGSQATTSAANNNNSKFKQFMSKWNCMSGAYGCVPNTKSR